jgi:predicted nucleic acid-binding protein
MADALVDSNVLFAFRSRGDQWHEPATAIVRKMDRGELPRGLVTNYTLPEVLNPIAKAAGHDRAVETLEFLTGSGGFKIRHLAGEDFSRGRALFRREDGVEITDAILVAFMRRTDTEFVYSFDDDFDRFEEVTRLDGGIDPFDPAE